MPRRAAAAPPNYNVDRDASSDSDLAAPPGIAAKATSPKQKPKRGRKPADAAAQPQVKAAKTRRNSDGRKKPAKEIPATQAPEDSADDLDLPASDDRAMSTPMTATKTRADVSAPTAPPAKATSESAAKPKAKRGRKPKPIKTEVPDTQVEHVEGEAQASSNFGRTAKSTKQPRPAKRDIVPATQVEDAMDLDGAHEDKTQPTRPRQPSPKALNRKRAGDDEGSGGDSATKRKLTDLSKRFESLEMRYEQLKDVGVREAAASFEELKRRTDERQKAADNLVSHLRTELAKQSTVAAEANDLKSEISNLTAVTEKVKSENKSLEASLSAAQGEIKALQAKLAATRATSEQRTVPGSAAKGNGKVMPGAASMDAQKMAVKKQLYGDLTGLIIRDVKRREDDDGMMDVYDCIQTGRNGTLRFHLAVPNPQPAGVPYGDADIEYTPLLDPSNDKVLLEILPDYLTDEILFPQREAQRFYGRINEFIMKSRPAQQEPQEPTNQDGDAERGQDAA